MLDECIPLWLIALVRTGGMGTEKSFQKITKKGNSIIFTKKFEQKENFLIWKLLRENFFGFGGK